MDSARSFRVLTSSVSRLAKFSKSRARMPCSHEWALFVASWWSSSWLSTRITNSMCFWTIRVLMCYQQSIRTTSMSKTNLGASKVSTQHLPWWTLRKRAATVLLTHPMEAFCLWRAYMSCRSRESTSMNKSTWTVISARRKNWVWHKASTGFGPLKKRMKK